MQESRECDEADAAVENRVTREMHNTLVPQRPENAERYSTENTENASDGQDSRQHESAMLI